MADLLPVTVDHETQVALPYKIGPTSLPFAFERFIQEYVICGNPGLAYRNAFGESTVKHPVQRARDLLRRPDVVARLREHQHAVAEMSVKTTDTLIRELEELVEADVSELVHVRIGSCRHCWGIGHMYQWRNEAEYEDAVRRSINRDEKDPPSCAGGFEYRFNVDPNENCPECEGKGVQRVFLADTETLSPGARRLYKGVECNADGSIKKILIADQFAARQELHRIRGMHVERLLQVSISSRLPDAKEIAGSPDKAISFLESLGK